MRRTLAALMAAAAAMLGLGFAGTANAQEPPVQLPQQPTVPFGAYISEFATQGVGANATFKEFIELSNRSSRNVAIGGHRVVANFSGRTVEIAQIPSFTVLSPGETYLLASQRFTGPQAPDQLFTTEQDIPNAVGLALFNRQGQPVDVVGTTYNTVFRAGTPALPLTTADAMQRLSLHHRQFTGTNRVDFQKGRATPGIPG